MEDKMNLGMEDQSINLHELEFIGDALTAIEEVIKELTDDRSDTTIVIFIKYAELKIYIVTDGRRTLSQVVPDEDYKRITSGDAVKLEGITLLHEATPRFVTCTSGRRSHSTLLKEQVIELANTLESVTDILDNVDVNVLNNQGVVTLAGFSTSTPQLIGEVRCVGMKTRGIRDGFFATGSGAHNAQEAFRKYCTRRSMLKMNDDQVFDNLRMCVGYSGARDRATGGFTNQALIHNRSVSFGRRYHLIHVLSRHYLNMSLGIGYIFLSTSLKETGEIKRFWEDSKVKKGVKSVWIAGKFDDTIVWIFQVDRHFRTPQPLLNFGLVTDTYYRLSEGRLADIANMYFGTADAGTALDRWW